MNAKGGPRNVSSRQESPVTYMPIGRRYPVVSIGGGNDSGGLVAFRPPRAAGATARPR